jgi:hypothetical protein
MDDYGDAIADKIEKLARDAIAGKLALSPDESREQCVPYLGDACIDLAVGLQDVYLTASVN